MLGKFIISGLRDQFYGYGLRLPVRDVFVFTATAVSEMMLNWRLWVKHFPSANNQEKREGWIEIAGVKDGSKRVGAKLLLKRTMIRCLYTLT